MAEMPYVTIRWRRWGVWLLASAVTAHESGWISARTYDRILTFVYAHALYIKPTDEASR